MFRSYTLQPAVWHQQPLEFEWDADSGEVKGAGAEKLLAMVAAAIKDGYVVGDPYPTSYSITDPLHNLGEMAAILGNDWKLPDDLAAAYPHIDDDDEIPVLIDESGSERPVDMIN
jgi:hypothetical protein